MDKQPGVRPIGVGEVLRRVIGKTVMKLLKKDVLKATGSLQLCAGHNTGSVAAIHAVYEMFNKERIGAVLMVDASMQMWRRGVVVITTAQLHSTKPELRFCTGSNPARGVSEIRDGEDL